MKSKIFFADARVKSYDYKYSFVAKFEQILQMVDFRSFIEKGDYVAVKTHFGSQGAHRIVRPLFLRKVVERVKEVGGHPFVTDTVRIPGLEYLEVANMEGINHLSVGAPVVMADGIFGRDQIRVKAGPILGEIGVASAIYYAPAMIVVSHCKGHIGSGFGGAIKNLAMGCISCKDHHGKAERGRIHFYEGKHLEWIEVRCTRCGQCVDVCPHKSLQLVDDSIVIDRTVCVKCARCARVCPVKALVVPIDEETFQKGLAESAYAVVSTFEKGRILYINFITEVQPECDCMPMADTPLVQDQGVLVSHDIVAIDQASLDMINGAEPLPGSKAADKNVKKGENILKAVTGKNAQLHIDAAHELGMGSKEYELIQVTEKHIPEGEAGH
ncbi:DUF362 domain-containing protein [Thermosediminibacter litoriperuensis]|uniref:Ferredoxin n=1 Tax=Thermosediminibacter litoriperuensis TaxID=291989 RepID=A0A5S5AVT9_9FIRM|nr:DUF362 domain-containing protein [Thermosediminibacter litoriperuensis]TYP57455.1 hypothetical protein LZ11_00769 [Thermosediminibacter litoriperuensis]